MRFVFVLGAALALCRVCSATNPSKLDCVGFAEAGRHVGTTQCISGTVLHIEDGRNGAKFLNFCHDSKACPFIVVVFPADLKKLGDIHQLEGQQIEIKGTVQDFGGRSEIILHRSQQLGDAAFRLFPPVPTDYDVERQGHSSAGKFRRPKASKKSNKRQGQPASTEDPEEP
jgi:hypothetical protein